MSAHYASFHFNEFCIILYTYITHHTFTNDMKNYLSVDRTNWRQTDIVSCCYIVKHTDRQIDRLIDR